MLLYMFTAKVVMQKKPITINNFLMIALKSLDLIINHYLKEATIMSSNFDKVKEIFEAENIDVELL